MAEQTTVGNGTDRGSGGAASGSDEGGEVDIRFYLEQTINFAHYIGPYVVKDMAIKALAEIDRLREENKALKSWLECDG